MSESVTEHQVRVYEYGKALAGRWFTIQDLSTDTNVPDASAKAYAVRFEEMGIFERLRASPAHLFRLSDFASSRDPKAVRRLDAAIPVFAEMRRERLQRELHALGISQRASNPKQAVIESQALAPRIPKGTDVLEVHGSEDPTDFAATAEESATASNNQPVTSQRMSKKLELLVTMVSRNEGASLEELSGALGNLPHSVRAMISVESRKRGLKIECVRGHYYLRS